MKLYYSLASPYACKVRVVAAEKGIPLELVAVAPADNPPELHAANPVGKIPTLITEGRLALPESHHICTYLESLQPTPVLFPAKGLESILRRDALAIGIMDAAVRHILESRRPVELQSNIWLERQINAINRTLAILENEMGTIGTDFTIDHITLAVALGYLNLRFGEMGWQEQHHKLAAWFGKTKERKSVRENLPA